MSLFILQTVQKFAETAGDALSRYIKFYPILIPEDPSDDSRIMIL